MHTEVLKNQQLSIITRNNYKFKIQSTPITWMPTHSNCFLFPFRLEVTRVYSRLPVTRTLYNSNLPLTRSIFISLQIVFYMILPSITRTPDNSNCFLFPLKVRVIGIRLYFHMYACLFVRISNYCKPKKTMNTLNHHKKAQDLQQADPKPVTK